MSTPVRTDLGVISKNAIQVQPEIEHLFEYMRPRLRALARGFLKTGMCVEAEDVVHDVFLRACLKLEKDKNYFQSKSFEHVENWFLRAAKNACINYVKSAKFRVKDEIEEKTIPSSLANSYNADLVEFSDFSNNILRCLTKKQQMIFNRFVNGEKQEDIAREMRMTLSNVKYHLTEAREKLKQAVVSLN